MARKKTEEKISSKVVKKEKIAIEDINKRVYKKLLEIEYSKGNFYVIPEGLYNNDVPEDVKMLNDLRECFLYQNPRSTIIFPEGLFESVRFLKQFIEVLQKNNKKGPKALQKEKQRKLRAFEEITNLVTHQKEMPIEKIAEKKNERLIIFRNRFANEKIEEFANSYETILDVEHFGRENKKAWNEEPAIIFERQKEKLIELVKLLSRVGCLQELMQAENKNIEIINLYLAKADSQPIVKVSEKYLLEQIRNLDMQKKEHVAIMQVYSLVLLNKLLHNYEEYLNSTIYFNILDDSKFRAAIENYDNNYNKDVIRKFESYLRNEISEQDIIQALKPINSIHDPEIYLTDLVEASFKRAFENDEIIMGIGELPLGSKQLKDTSKFQTYYKKIIENYIDISLDGTKKENKKFKKDRSKLIQKIKADKKKIVQSLELEGNLSKKLIKEIKEIDEELWFNQIRSVAESIIRKDFEETLEKLDRTRVEDIRKYIAPTRSRTSVLFSKIQFSKDIKDELEEVRKQYLKLKIKQNFSYLFKEVFAEDKFNEENDVENREQVEVQNNVQDSEQDGVQTIEANQSEDQDENINVNIPEEFMNHVKDCINSIQSNGIIKDAKFLIQVADIIETKNQLNEVTKILLKQILQTERKYVYFQNNTILGNSQKDVKTAGTINILLNNHIQIFGGHYLSNEFEYSSEEVQGFDIIPQEASLGFKANNGLNLRVSVPMRYIDSFQKRAFRDLSIIMDDIDNETSVHVSINLISLYNELRDFKLDHPNEYQALKITCLLGSGVKYYRMFSQGKSITQSLEKNIEKDRQLLEAIKNKEYKKQDNQELKLREFAKLAIWKNVNEEGNNILNEVEEAENIEEDNVTDEDIADNVYEEIDEESNT